MNDLILVDTDILIDLAHEVSTAINCVAKIENQAGLAISVISQMELLVGCRNKLEMKYTRNFLTRFKIINLEDIMCNTAIKLLYQYRLSHGLLIADALIAATAIVMNFPFISKNQRDYRFISELRLLAYPY